jgi:hypothetical protein
MKKKLTILSVVAMFIAILTVSAADILVWEGSTTLDWAAEPGVNIPLSADKFASAKVGDVIRVEGTAADGAQVKICINYPWKESETVSVLPLEYTIVSADSNESKVETDLTSQESASSLPLTLQSDWSAFTYAAAASQQPCYNLCGQRVAEPAKGLYVAEGKKFVVR